MPKYGARPAQREGRAQLAAERGLFVHAFPHSTTSTPTAIAVPPSLSLPVIETAFLATIYSGIIYRAMGIPTNMFTVMFALGRLPGWIAHWKELRDDPTGRINRPRRVRGFEHEPNPKPRHR